MNKIFSIFHTVIGLFTNNNFMNLKPSKVEIIFTCDNMVNVDMVLISSLINVFESHDNVPNAHVDGNNLIIDINL